MSGTIGGITCDWVKGIAPSGKMRLDVWQVPGISGYGAQKLGAGDSACAFRCIRVLSSANLDTWEASIEALQGAIVTVVNDRGKTYTRFLVSRIGIPQRVPAYPNEKSTIIVQGVIT